MCSYLPGLNTAHIGTRAPKRPPPIPVERRSRGFGKLYYRVVGWAIGLVAMDAPLSFMALLGIISLMGVIVSHVIVLFDFIEEAHERGAPMREALLDAGLMRLRPC